MLRTGPFFWLSEGVGVLVFLALFLVAAVLLVVVLMLVVLAAGAWGVARALGAFTATTWHSWRRHRHRARARDARPVATGHPRPQLEGATGVRLAGTDAEIAEQLAEVR